MSERISRVVRPAAAGRCVPVFTCGVVLQRALYDTCPCQTGHVRAQSPLLRVNNPMSEYGSQKDSALQLLGDVCLQPARSEGSAECAARAAAPELGVKPELEVHLASILLRPFHAFLPARRPSPSRQAVTGGNWRGRCDFLLYLLGVRRVLMAKAATDVSACILT